MNANADPVACNIRTAPASPGDDCEGEAECPILILAPLGNDAKLTAEFLRAAGLAATICRDVADLVSRKGVQCGAILIAEEVIDQEAAGVLAEVLDAQPS